MERGVDDVRNRLVLLAENDEGYVHLIKLVTSAYMEGFFDKPRMDREILEKWHKGVIAILPSFSGEHVAALRGNDMQKAMEIVAWYVDTFGKDNVFLEITHHPEIEGHEYLQTQIKELAKKTNVPLLAAHNTYYLEPEDREAR
jgi:DNA polymerase-3 subunit alpha